MKMVRGTTNYITSTADDQQSQPARSVQPQKSPMETALLNYVRECPYVTPELKRQVSDTNNPNASFVTE